MDDTPISKKVEYVKSQGQTREHHCHWPGCNKQVKPAMWGCYYHWMRLPKHFRDRIWQAYRVGQELDRSPSREYLEVAREVQEWIMKNPEMNDVVEPQPVKPTPKPAPTHNVETLSKASGIPAQVIRNWIHRERFTPTGSVAAVGGPQHRFSVMQSLGIMVAHKVRQTVRSCSHVYFTRIIAAFTQWKESELLDLLSQQRPYFDAVYTTGVRLVKNPTHDNINVDALYKKVKSCL